MSSLYASASGAAPVTRSNRPLTQFACRLLSDFLLGKLEPCTLSNHNTTVICTESKSSATFEVQLFDVQILSLTLAMPSEEPVHLALCFSDKFTIDGFPTRTTIERLNGLLDCLGAHGILPAGVRIFKDHQQGVFYLGKRDKRIPVGEKYARNVRLKPDADEFIVEMSDLGIA